jgi:signal transduction histidine kinase
VTPIWWTRRRAGITLALAALATVALLWNHRHAERAFVRDVGRALPISVGLSAGVLGDWFAVRVDALGAGARLEARVDAAATPQLVLSLPGRPPATAPRERPIELAERTLPQFNVAAPDDRTQRTILVDASGGAMRVLLVSAPGGGPRPPVTARAIPAGLEGDTAWRAQLNDTSAGRDGAIARGIAGQPVVRGQAAVPGTPLLLVRERDVDELRALIRPALLVSDAILTVLAGAALALLLLRWRTTTLRAERDAMALRSAFVSSVSHELRTPLTQIRMHAELLQLGYLADAQERQRALGVIQREAERLGVLVDQALAFVSSGQRPAPVAATPTPIVEALSRVTATLAPLLAERQVTVQHTVAPALTVRLSLDALQQVLLNVLSNALTHGPAGQTIRVGATSTGNEVTLTIDDEGPGIPPSEQQRVWAPFVRGAGAAHGAGSGIGLAVVRDLVTAVGGRATLADPPAGRGARVELLLPAA